MKVMTIINFRGQKATVGQSELLMFLKLSTGQMITAVMYITTARTLQTSITLSMGTGSQDCSLPMVVMMKNMAKIKQME